MNQEITIKRSSNKTGECSEIILRDKHNSKLVFKPTIVDNSRDADESISGDLIYVKDEFDSHGEIVLSPQKVQKSNHIKINLRTSEVKMLFGYLRELYQVDPNGFGDSLKLISANTEYQAFLNYFDKKPEVLESVIVEHDSFELIKGSQKILEAIARDTSIMSNLMDVEGALENVGYLAQIKSIKHLCSRIEDNLDNEKESFWQDEILAKNTWILSQIFAEPMIVLEGVKAYLGGKDIDNKNGKIVDFAYKNSLTNHVAFIEIKTPKTKIVGSEYRSQVYSIHPDLTGAVSQVMMYKKIFQEDFISIKHRTENEEFDSVNPKTVVIAGKIKTLSKYERYSFDLYRRELKDTVIITFDELLEKINGFINALSNKGY